MIKRISILTIALIFSGLTMTACGQNNQNSGRANSNQTQEINIPSGVKNSTYDGDVNWESVLFIKVGDDNKTYLRKSGLSELKDGKTIICFNYIPLTDANFNDEIGNVLNGKTPDKRSAYIQADTTVRFGKLTELFEKLAKDEFTDQIRFVVNPLKEVEKSEQTDHGGYVLSLTLPPKPAFADKNQKSGGNGNGLGTGNGRGSDQVVALPPGYRSKSKTAEELAAEEKAKKLAAEKTEARKKIKVEKLSVEFGGAGKIKFNNQTQTPEELSANLKKVFDERTSYDIFRDGTNEVDNTVYLKILPNADYGGAVKMIDKLYALGAKWIYLDGSPNN